MSKPTIRVSEAEAASDLWSLLARVRAGAEVVIERNAEAVAVLRPAAPDIRLLSESLRLANECGSNVTLEDQLLVLREVRRDGFADDKPFELRDKPSSRTGPCCTCVGEQARLFHRPAANGEPRIASSGFMTSVECPTYRTMSRSRL